MKIWTDLAPSERSQVVITVGMFMFFTILILMAFLTSRGQDVDYFKLRISLLEQRINNLDVKTDSLVQSDHKLKNYIDDQSRLILEIDRAQKTQQAELDAWKKLPRLPVNQQKKIP